MTESTTTTAVTVMESEPVAPPDGEWEINMDGVVGGPVDVGAFINNNWDRFGSDLEVLYYCQAGEHATFGGFTVRRVK